jgi:hypothetical protein
MRLAHADRLLLSCGVFLKIITKPLTEPTYMAVRIPMLTGSGHTGGGRLLCSVKK